MKVFRFERAVYIQKNAKAQLNTVIKDEFSESFQNLNKNCSMCTRTVRDYFQGKYW
jgi:hypothetical protein